MKDYNAGFECFGFHECELMLLSSFWKQPLPTSQHHRMNHKPEFSNKIMVHQGVHKLPTASNQNMLTWLLFQLLYLLHVASLISVITLPPSVIEYIPKTEIAKREPEEKRRRSYK
jgi:hypothetical protein